MSLRVGILNERFAETETAVEQTNSLLQDELSAAESALRKEKAARKEAQLLGEANPHQNCVQHLRELPKGRKGRLLVRLRYQLA